MNKNYLECLGKTELFKDVNEKVYKKLIKTENMVKYKKGDNVLFSSENNEKIGIVLKGELALHKKGEDNKAKMILAKYNLSDVVGTSFAFNKKEEIPFNVSALSNSTVLFIDKENMKSLFKEEDKILDNYFSLISKDTYNLGKKIEGFTAKSAEEKLSVFLLEHLDEVKTTSGNTEYKVMLDYSMSKLATVLDLGRASLYRAVDTLENNYVIMRNKKDIKIIDLEKLKKICGK